MQGRKVVLTWEAIYDITDIADYIERDFGVKRAEKFESDIRKQIIDISYQGGMYGNTYLYYRSYPIFKKLFPPSIIFYVVKEPEKEVHILRVLRQENDWKSTLETKQDYTYME